MLVHQEPEMLQTRDIYAGKCRGRLKGLSCNTSNKRKNVSSDIETPRSGLTQPSGISYMYMYDVWVD